MQRLHTIPVADEEHLNSLPASNLQRWNKDKNALPRVRTLSAVDVKDTIFHEKQRCNFFFTQWGKK